MAVRPSEYPIWATNLGTNILTGLDVDDILFQNLDQYGVAVIRYNFNASPDLSGVTIGNSIIATLATNPENRGQFKIIAVNNTLKYVDILNSARLDNSLDETSSPCIVDIVSTASVIVEPSTAKQGVGWSNKEKPPEGYLNWQQNLNYRWILYFDEGGGGAITTYNTIAILRAIDTNAVVNGAKAEVVDFGIYRFNSTSVLSDDGETVIDPTTGPGRWELIIPHPNAIFDYQEPDISDLQYKLENIRYIDSRVISITANIFATSEIDLNILFSGVNAGDGICISPVEAFTVNLGIMSIKSIIDNQLRLRLRNFSASTINLVNSKFRITVIRS